MAKKKIGRALAGLAALGTMGALAARKSSLANEERVRSMSPAPPAPMRQRNALEELQEDLQRVIETDRASRGKPVITPEEHADIMHDVKGVRDSSGIPWKAGDGVLQEANPSVRPARPGGNLTRSRVGLGLKGDHYVGRNLETLDPATDSVDPSSPFYKKGGEVKSRSSRSSRSNASRRGDGIAIRGKTKGRML
jgi:hypothetical protein